MNSVGHNIRSAREKEGLSRTELAAHLGTSERTVERWEAGKHAPDLPTLRRIAGALFVSTAELLASDEDEPVEAVA